MKFLSNLLILLMLGTMLSSCINVNDEVWIESDGTGRFESTTDLSSVLPFMAMGMQQEMEKAKEEGAGADDNPMTAFMEMAMSGEAVDTVFNFRSMLEQSLAAEGKSWEMLMDSLENASLDGEMTEAQRESMLGVFQTISDMKIRMQVDQEAPLFKTTNIQQFANLNELSSMGESISEMTKLMEAGEGAQSPLGGDDASAMLEQIFGGQTLMDLDGDVLRIRRAGFDLSALGEEVEQNMAMIKMFLGDEPYRLTIHFPGKVKKISSDMIKKVDKKTVMLEIPLNDLLDPEMRFDATVKFKGLK
jgi:hypothetical protein